MGEDFGAMIDTLAKNSRYGAAQTQRLRNGKIEQESKERKGKDAGISANADAG